MSEPKRYCYSTNGETFSGPCDSFEAAIEECFDGTDEDFCSVGEIVDLDLNAIIDVDSFLERTSENMFEEVGEISEDWLTRVTPEQNAELFKLIEGWIAKTDPVRFWKVANVKAVDRLQSEAKVTP